MRYSIGARPVHFANHLSRIALVFLAASPIAALSQYARGQVNTATYAQTEELPFQSQNVPGTYSASYSAPGETGYYAASSSQASSTINASLDPSVSVSSSESGAGSAYGNATAEVDYEFEVMGPQVSTYPYTVPVLAVASGAASAATTSYNAGLGTPNGVSAVIHLNAGDLENANGLLYEDMHTTISGSPLSFSIDTDIQVVPGDPILVDASVTAGDPQYTAGSASASVDPQFTIDPSFPDASQYSIIFSPNLPEPMSSGFVALSLLTLLCDSRQRKSRLVKSRSAASACGY